MGELLADDGLSPHVFSVLTDDDNLLDCFLNFPEVNAAAPHALDYTAIAAAQAQNVALQQTVLTEPLRFVGMQMLPIANVICHIKQPNNPWIICIPDASLEALVSWYHQKINHTSITRFYETIALHF